MVKKTATSLMKIPFLSVPQSSQFGWRSKGILRLEIDKDPSAFVPPI